MDYCCDANGLMRLPEIPIKLKTLVTWTLSGTHWIKQTLFTSQKTETAVVMQYHTRG